MLRAILNRKEMQLLKDEKSALQRLQAVLAGFDVEPEDQRTLHNSIQQLDNLFLLVIVTSRRIETVGDAALGGVDEPLSPRRVQAAQALALLSALLYVWWAGMDGIIATLTLWAAMTGVGIYRLAILFLQRRR